MECSFAAAVFGTDVSFIAVVHENRSCNGSIVDLPLFHAFTGCGTLPVEEAGR